MLRGIDGLSASQRFSVEGVELGAGGGSTTGTVGRVQDSLSVVVREGTTLEI